MHVYNNSTYCYKRIVHKFERERDRSGGTREGGMELIEMQYLFKKSKRNKKVDFKSHVVVFEHRGRDK